ncbi:MAG: hypothetical protein JXA64_00105 [Candidatus Fermentibacteraceae bacterium]|nr:hypothetical protein [Candidatus Fermentibacteraceae bacterium]MBN2607486.1 hypothetical protein [Candidatus Fermentibacteraceae bacterium]
MAAELIVFDPLETLPEEDRVLARSGCPPSRRGRFGAEAREAIESLSRAAQPEAIVSTMDVRVITEDEVVTGEMHLKSASLARFMKGAEKVSVFLVTLGSRPEREARRLQDEGCYTRSFFLDAAASCMVDRLARELHRRLTGEFPGCRATARFAPGFGDFSLASQEDIIVHLGGGSIGVSLQRDSYTLLPVKSGTGVIGWISLKS